MDNRQFIEELSSRLDISVASVETMVGALCEEFSKVTSNMDGIVIPGFGTFEPRIREERVALHPASGKRILVPPKMFLAFKQSPVLKQKINNGK